MVELVKKAKRGDKESFALLVNQVKDKAYKVAFTYLKNKEDSLDAVMEASEDHTRRANLRDDLKLVYDLERLGSKIGMGQCNARDFLALKQSLVFVITFKSPFLHFTIGSSFLMSKSTSG